MNNLFSVFEVFAGLYLIYGAVSGKGQIYNTENIKKGKEQAYRKTMRICSAVVGVVMMTQGLLDYVYTSSPSPALFKATTALLVASVVGVGCMFYFSIRMTDKKKVNRQREKKNPAPRAAFEFDEDSQRRENSSSGKGNKEK